MKWYALFVKAGNEEYVAKWIKNTFYNFNLRTIIPKKKITEKRQGKKHKLVRIIFPGYAFIQTNMSYEMWHKIKKIPKVLRILNNGTYYSEIEDYEIEPILKFLGQNDTIDYSEVFFRDSQVYIKDGPLKGYEGLIYKIDKRKQRATVIFDFMDKKWKVDLGLEILDAI